MNFGEILRKVVNRVIGKSTVEQALKIQTAASPVMIDAINLWGEMYQNAAPWLNSRVQSLELPAAIAQETARLITVEMQSEITGSARADFLNDAYRQAISPLRRMLEYACAKGGMIFKPYISGQGLAIDFVQPDNFFPIGFNNSGRLTDVAFVERIQTGAWYYTRLERHRVEGGNYIVTNTAYKSKTETELGHEISLGEVDAWALLEPEAIITGVTRPLYGYFRVPLANTIDPASPMGVSIYSRAVGLIEQADRQYSRYLWEYEGSELAIDASIDLFKKENGKLKMPQGKDRLYRTYDADAGDGLGIKVFSPAIRDEALANGLNRLFQRIEFNCGLAYGTISDPQTVDKTAEEVRTSKQRSYAMVCDMQAELERALEDLVYAMDIWTTLGRLAPAGLYELSFEWGDGVLTDLQSEQAIRMQEVSAGLLRPEHYLMWRYGISEDEALRRLPSSNRELIEVE